MVVWSAVAHAGALGLALVSPGPSKTAPPLVISVDLLAPSAAMSSASAPAKPKLAEAPAPTPVAPPPPPAPPKPKQVVLPEKPQAPKPEAKPKPKPRERETFEEPPKKEEKSLEELLAEMRSESGDATPAPEPSPGLPTETAAAPSPGAIGGTGPMLSPEELDWHARVKRKLKGVWVVPPGFRAQPLETQVAVTLDASGNLLGDPRITRRSGNPWFDEGVVRGLNKANPLPPPPEAGEWALWFRPGDSL